MQFLIIFILSWLVFFSSPVSAFADLNAGMVGHWSFDEGSGATANDCSVLDGSGNCIGLNPGYAIGPTWTTGVVGTGAIVLNGSNSYIALGHTGALNMTGAMTISAWINPKNAGGGTQDLVGKGSTKSAANDTQYTLFMNTYGGEANLNFNVSNGNSILSVNSANNKLSNDTWYHVVGTYDGASTICIYINGANNGCQSSNNFGTLNSYPSDPTIGTNSFYPSQYFNGAMDDVRMYSRALAASEVLALYQQVAGTNSAPTPATPDPVTASFSNGNVYISDSGTGSGASCSDALSANWFNTNSNWGIGAGQIGPGTTVHLCGNITTNLVAQMSGTAANVITILFEPGATMSKPAWSGNIIDVSGLNYITIDGGATGKIGGYTGNPTLANGIIESTDNGTAGSINPLTEKVFGNQVDSVGIKAQESHYLTVQNLVIRNLYVRVSGADGGAGTAIATRWNGGSAPSFITVNNCILHDMAVGFSIDYGPGSQNFTYSNSTAYDVNWGGNAGDHSNTSTMTKLVVSNDYFHDFVNWDQPGNAFHHNGFYAWAESGGTLNDVTYSGNVVGPNFSVGNPNNQTSGLFVSGAGVTGTVSVYNNLFIENATTNPPANGDLFIWPGPGSSTRIYNNTFVGSGSGNAMQLYGSHGGVQMYDVKNNIATAKTFINVAYGLGVNLISNNNIGYNLTSGEEYSWSLISSSVFFNFVAWKGLGYDNNSLSVNPNLDANYKPQALSPAINSGLNLSSYFSTDIIGNPRSKDVGTNWDIGAFSSSTSGDVSNNGRVTIYDASLVSRYLQGSENLTSDPTELTRAYLNGNGKNDGVITAADVKLIAQKSLGL